MTPAGLPPVGLKCAHLDNPLAVAPDRVRFSWLPAGGLQRAYQIQVFPNEGSRLPQATPLWDSGQAPSGESADVPYGGPPLTLRPKLPMNCCTPAEIVVCWGFWMTMVGHR